MSEAIKACAREQHLKTAGIILRCCEAGVKSPCPTVARPGSMYTNLMSGIFAGSKWSAPLRTVPVVSRDRCSRRRYLWGTTCQLQSKRAERSQNSNFACYAGVCRARRNGRRHWSAAPAPGTLWCLSWCSTLNLSVADTWDCWCLYRMCQIAVGSCVTGLFVTGVHQILLLLCFLDSCRHDLCACRACIVDSLSISIWVWTCSTLALMKTVLHRSCLTLP